VETSRSPQLDQGHVRGWKLHTTHPRTSHFKQRHLAHSQGLGTRTPRWLDMPSSECRAAQPMTRTMDYVVARSWPTGGMLRSTWPEAAVGRRHPHLQLRTTTPPLPSIETNDVHCPYMTSNAPAAWPSILPLTHPICQRHRNQYCSSIR
jgi:hypothetical protein